MQQFLATRPLSVLASFALMALNALHGLASLPALGDLVKIQRELKAWGDPALMKELSLNYALLPVFSLAFAILPILTMAALYRDSRLGFRAMIVGSGVSLAMSACLGAFPATFPVEVALILWMAYELNGFNLLAWTEQKLVAARVERDGSV